jgi:hypothetical protein
VSARALLDEIASAGGRIEAHGDRLRLRAPTPLPPELIARIRDAKPVLLAAISARETSIAAEPERIPAAKHDAAIPRAWAEGFAMLDPGRPRGDVPPSRWQRFIDDVGRFLDSEFCAHAAALGWGSHDLFGCDCDRPFARVDQAGLLLLLNGDELVALSENTATIRTRTGAPQTYRRKPNAPGQVLPWELA